MVFKVTLSIRANVDVEKILLYLFENWNEKIIDDFMTELAAALTTIEKSPYNFPKVDFESEILKFQLKSYYVIFYHLEENEITILSIFDQRQDPEKLKAILEDD